MSDASSPAFRHDAYLVWVRALASALEQHSAAGVEAAARLLVVSSYGPDVDSSALPFGQRNPRRVPFSEAFVGRDALVSSARSGAPAAVEAALEVLSSLDPERAASLALEGRELRPWPALRTKLGIALSRSAAEPSFLALLDAVPDGAIPQPEAGFLLLNSPYPGGCEHVLRRLDASPVARFGPVGAAPATEARHLLRYLGQKACAGARPLVMRLFSEHPDSRVRMSAGHAIFDYGDREGLDFLSSFENDADADRRWFATKAQMALAPERSSEVLDRAPAAGRSTDEIVRNATQLLDIDSKAKESSGGTPWVLADPRWLDILARLAVKGHAGALTAMNRFPADVRERALAAATAAGQAARRARPARGTADTPRGGTRRDRELRAEIDATMQRAREHLSRIVERLTNLGYRVEEPKYVLDPPHRDAVELIARLEAVAGPLPHSLRAAYLHLGACNLSGDHPDWPRTANVRLRPAARQDDVWLTDPLVLAPLASALETAEEHSPHGAPFELAIAGDPLTKAGYSGGAYRIQVPSMDADAEGLGEPGGRKLVDHLRTSLAFGGFAGFADIPDRPASFIEAVVAGLPPL